jgi:hypothetical protein
MEIEIENCIKLYMLITCLNYSLYHAAINIHLFYFYLSFENSNKLWMRSSRVLRASDCQYACCNNTSSIPASSDIQESEGWANLAVVNLIIKKFYWAFYRRTHNFSSHGHKNQVFLPRQKLQCGSTLRNKILSKYNIYYKCLCSCRLF